MNIQIKYLHPEYSLKYATEGSAALDCCSCYPGIAYVYPQEVLKIPLGFALHIADPTVAGLLLPRSGLGAKGIVLANLIGLIDSDYQGEICALLWNRNDRDTPPFKIEPGDRIAQLLFVKIALPALIPVADFDAATARGTEGFGSTGVK